MIEDALCINLFSSLESCLTIIEHHSIQLGVPLFDLLKACAYKFFCGDFLLLELRMGFGDR